MSIELNSLERRTRELFEKADKPFGEMNHIMLSKVFATMWAHSLSINRIIKIAKAIYDIDGPIDFDPALKNLVKQKVLRTRKVQNVTLYEVNY